MPFGRLRMAVSGHFARRKTSNQSNQGIVLEMARLLGALVHSITDRVLMKPEVSRIIQDGNRQIHAVFCPPEFEDTKTKFFAKILLAATLYDEPRYFISSWLYTIHTQFIVSRKFDFDTIHRFHRWILDFAKNGGWKSARDFNVSTIRITIATSASACNPLELGEPSREAPAGRTGDPINQAT
ncbi:hypothetical protein K470DRAFT_150566 [Piedraia hortae CBS 480.64]|uniref:Uncharacterized protein n=1 Tax=Piedraia hortae CBS 480.64 TaxID=1314780 RepID=A0A6A7BRK1_9PEZI|nr:hypothetical protein K470DRAFT_150566 [Piedraia hortae CBS 480.64]